MLLALDCPVKVTVVETRPNIFGTRHKENYQIGYPLSWLTKYMLNYSRFDSFIEFFFQFISQMEWNEYVFLTGFIERPTWRWSWKFFSFPILPLNTVGNSFVIFTKMLVLHPVSTSTSTRELFSVTVVRGSFPQLYTWKRVSRSGPLQLKLLLEWDGALEFGGAWELRKFACSRPGFYSRAQAWASTESCTHPLSRTLLRVRVSIWRRWRLSWSLLHAWTTWPAISSSALVPNSQYYEYKRRRVANLPYRLVFKLTGTTEFKTLESLGFVLDWKE